MIAILLNCLATIGVCVFCAVTSVAAFFNFWVLEFDNMGKSCCFFGHRNIEYTEELERRIYEQTENLILSEGADTFYFGSKSEFNSLCRDVVTDLKEKYPQIKRIYIRAEFPHINKEYKDYLLESYDDTYFSEKALGAGRACYVIRNREMIDKSDFCIVYYKEDYIPKKRRNSKRDLFEYQPKSGTKIAYDYAVKKGKNIICVV